MRPFGQEAKGVRNPPDDERCVARTIRGKRCLQWRSRGDMCSWHRNRQPFTKRVGGGVR